MQWWRTKWETFSNEREFSVNFIIIYIPIYKWWDGESISALLVTIKKITRAALDMYSFHIRKISFFLHFVGKPCQSSKMVKSWSVLSMAESQNLAISAALRRLYSDYRPIFTIKRAQILPCISAIAPPWPLFDNTDLDTKFNKQATISMRGKYLSINVPIDYDNSLPCTYSTHDSVFHTQRNQH